MEYFKIKRHSGTQFLGCKSPLPPSPFESSLPSFLTKPGQAAARLYRNYRIITSEKDLKSKGAQVIASGRRRDSRKKSSSTSPTTSASFPPSTRPPMTPQCPLKTFKSLIINKASFNSINIVTHAFIFENRRKLANFLPRTPRLNEVWALSQPFLYFLTKLLFIKPVKYICIENGRKYEQSTDGQRSERRQVTSRAKVAPVASRHRACP